MRELVRSSLSALSNGRLWALQLAGNAVLFAAVAAWLTIGEEHIWQLVLTLVLAVVMVFCFGWLHAGTMASFVDSRTGSVRSGFRTALRHLVAFLVWVAILGTLLYLANRWSEKTWQVAGYISSRVSSSTRSWLSWSFVDNAVSFCFFILKWYIIAGLLLPFGAAAACGVTRGSVKCAIATLGKLAYWTCLAVFVLVGVYIPKVIMGWTPESTLRGETISLVVRLLVSYLLAVGCWLMAANMTSRASHSTSVVADATGNTDA